MALTINTNVPSLNAQRNLSKSQNDLSRSMQRLSSGLRINSAKDDAAGLAISDRMTSQIRGLNQAARNSNDGISMAQTAEGALQETTNILQRMRELAIQSANDTNSSSDRASLQAEINQLQQEVTRIASSTSFNNRNVLDGNLNNAQFQVGANANETISFSIPSAKAPDLGINNLKSEAAGGPPLFGIETATGPVADTSAGNNVALQELEIVGPDGTEKVNIAAQDNAMTIANTVNLESAITGVTAEARTTATISDLISDGTIGFDLQGSNANPISISATVETDDLSFLARAINEQAGKTGILATLSGDKKSIELTHPEGEDIKIADYTHSDDNAASTITITGNEGDGVALEGDTGSTADSTVIGGEISFYSTGIFNINSDVDGGFGSLLPTVASVANASTLNSVDDIDISTVEGSAEAIKTIDGAISQIDTIRGDLGAIQNRFESTISNLQNVSENLSAARSRILDADIAQETSAMTKNNILQQAGVSILTQANQTPQLALQLLQG